MTDIKERKRELRRKIKERAAALSETYCEEADQAICRKLISMPEYEKAKVLFCYVGTKREINTMPVLKDALERGIRLGVPKCLEYGRMEVREIKSLDQLVPGAYGILEPIDSCPLIGPEEIDLACIPCLTADSGGRRLGYGGGFYDRYLPKLQCPKIILCRKKLMEEKIPTEEYDVTGDVVVWDE